MAMIWDGKQFRFVDDKEAELLEQQDKAQNLSARFIDGAELKRREQFTGYHTRELRAQSEALPAGVDWRDFKDEVAQALGLKRVHKKHVLRYLANRTPATEPARP